MPATAFKAPPNETSEERQRREEANKVGKDLVDDLKAKVDDEKVIEARIEESEKERNARQAQHTADERALQDLGRVKEIADSLERDEAAHLAKLDNAARRLRGMAGNPVKVVAEAVKAVAKRHGLSVTPEGLQQPKTLQKPGSFMYPFYND